MGVHSSLTWNQIDVVENKALPFAVFQRFAISVCQSRGRGVCVCIYVCIARVCMWVLRVCVHVCIARARVCVRQTGGERKGKIESYTRRRRRAMNDPHNRLNSSVGGRFPHPIFMSMALLNFSLGANSTM